MDIYKNIDSNFLKNKKILMNFSKKIKKKEQIFLKYIIEQQLYCKKTNKFIKKNQFKIDLKEIMKILNYKDQQSIFKFLKSLSEKKIEYSISEKDKIIVNGWLNIINSFHFSHNNIFLTFSNEIINNNIDQLFSKIDVYLFVFLSNNSTFYLYNYLIFYNNNNNNYSIELSIEKLKSIMNIEDKYERFFDFENNILKKAIKDINNITEYNVSYTKIKSGSHLNNKIEKLNFFIIKKGRENEKIDKNKINEQINFLMSQMNNDISDFSAMYEIIKTFLIKKNFEYVKQNIEYSKQNCNDNLEKAIRKSLLMDFANYSKNSIEQDNLKMAINIKKKYTSTFFIQKDLSKLLREKKLNTYFDLLYENQIFASILTMKVDTTLEKTFTNCRIFIHFSKSEESSIILWTK